MFRRPPFAAAALALLVLTSCTTWKEPKEASFKNATSLEHYERLMWKAMQAGEWKDVEAHMAPTFVLLDADGVHDRAAAMERMKQMKVTEVSLGEFQTQPNGADMTVTYTAMLRGTSNGKQLSSEPMRVMSVWQSVKRGWIQVAQARVTPAPAVGEQK